MEATALSGPEILTAWPKRGRKRRDSSSSCTRREKENASSPSAQGWVAWRGSSTERAAAEGRLEAHFAPRAFPVADHHFLGAVQSPYGPPTWTVARKAFASVAMPTLSRPRPIRWP